MTAMPAARPNEKQSTVEPINQVSSSGTASRDYVAELVIQPHTLLTVSFIMSEWVYRVSEHNLRYEYGCPH